MLEREEQELRTQHIGAQQHKNALIEEKGMYDTKKSIVIIQKKEKDIRDLANEIERLKRTLPDLKRRLGQEHSRRYAEAAKLKSFTDRVCLLFYTCVFLELMERREGVCVGEDEIR